jgi:type IV pilus assembly protein PilM
MLLSQLFGSAHTSSAIRDRVVGIDIGSSSIKIVELEDRKGIVTLTTYGELQLGPYHDKAIGSVVTLTSEEEKQALIDVLRESAVKATEAVFSIPLASSFVTTIPITESEDVNIESIIRIEARKYIPLPLAEVALDWAEIKKNADSDERQVLLAAIQNNPLRRYRSLLEGVQFGNAPTEIECFSALRGVGTAQGTHAVIDLGASVAKLYIVSNGALQRMYRVTTGAKDFVPKIVEHLPAYKDTVVDLLADPVGLSKNPDLGALQKIHTDLYRKTITEFSNVIRDYEKVTASSIETIQVIGSGGMIPGFLAYMHSAFQKPVSYAKPFSQVAFPAFMEDTLTAIGPIFATALGAALRNF